MGESDERDAAGDDDEVQTRRARAAAAARGLAVDLTPLRASRDFRLLWFGELISQSGHFFTVVAIFVQVFALTESAAAVGLVGLVQVVPLIVATTFGGVLVDRVDRRTLVLLCQVGFAGTSGLLLVNALLPDPSLLAIYVGAGLAAGISGIDFPARSALVPNLVPRSMLPSALALNQVMFNVTMLVGPAAGGLVIAQLGVAWAYGIDIVSYGAALAAALLMRPHPPQGDAGAARPGAFAAVREGFAFLKGRRVLQSTFVIDLIAMIFGMPRALFPVLAAETFHVGAAGVGILYAAPAAGAVLGAAASGWVTRVRHQGRAVVWAVIAWGVAIAGFGLVGFSFWLGVALLAVAGAADVFSAVFRSTILQVAVPDSLRGRISAIHILVVTGGPRLGDFEAGAVAALVSPLFSVVSGGLACVLGAALLPLFVPALWRYHAGEDTRGRDGRAGSPVVTTPGDDDRSPFGSPRSRRER